MEPKEISANILKVLEQGWNNGSGAEFAKPFAAKVEFVDVTGTLHQSQSVADVANAHQGLFMSIYKDSQIVYELIHAMQIDQNTILANAKTELNAPSGPLAGKNNSTITMVLTMTNDTWKILAFHNTLVMKR